MKFSLTVTIGRALAGAAVLAAFAVCGCASETRDTSALKGAASPTPLPAAMQQQLDKMKKNQEAAENARRAMMEKARQNRPQGGQAPNPPGPPKP